MDLQDQKIDDIISNQGGQSLKLEEIIATQAEHTIMLNELIDDAMKTAKDIKISSTVCFSHSFFNSLTAGAKAEFGAEWPVLVSLNAKGNVDLKVAGTKLDLGSKICISIPLYKYSSFHLVDYDDEATADFDELVSYIAAPSQALIPLIAKLYTDIMPSGQEALDATNNVIAAASNPSLLFQPSSSSMFGPVLANSPYNNLVSGIPGVFTADACDILNGSLMGISSPSSVTCSFNSLINFAAPGNVIGDIIKLVVPVP